MQIFKIITFKVNMRLFVVLLIIVFSPVIQAKDTFQEKAKKEIHSLINDELWGHYNLLSISILKTKDHTAEWGGEINGYGIKSLTVSFTAIRNGDWHKSLNREVVSNNCGRSNVWLLCQPKGHRFEGKVEVDVVSTVNGWKILTRNYRNKRLFPLSNYIVMEDIPKEGYVLPPPIINGH